MDVNKINARYFSKGAQLELYKHHYLDLLPPEKILFPRYISGADKVLDLGCGAGRTTGADGRVTITLLYFVHLARLTGRDEEEVAIPESVTNVETLLAWLCSRRQEWHEAFQPDKVQVTVNRNFAEPFTLIEHGDEVAVVPRG